MDKEMLMFGNIEIENHKVYCYKSLIFLEDVDINKLLVSNNVPFSTKTINTVLVTCVMIIKSSH